MDDRYLKQSSPQSRRYRKRVLAVRAMAGETVWLDGAPLWREGRVVWETDRGTVAPTRSILALARRRLGQIAGSPRASRHALGDPSGWLARRFARLEAAKRLTSLHEPDLAALCGRASLQRKDDLALQRLASLLAAEAYCLNHLSPSPAQALYSTDARAIPSLLAIASDPDELPASRVLSALVLGALRKSGKWDVGANASFEPGWQSRAYSWGLGNGLPDDPALYVALLQEDGSIDRAGHLADLRRRAGAYLPGTESLRKLLDQGVAGATVVELCRACAEIEPLAGRIGNYRQDLPDKPAMFRTEKASELRKTRAQTINDLVALVHRYALGTADPTVVRGALAVTSYVVHARSNYHNALGEAAANVLRRGLDLPAELQGAFLGLLHEHRDQIWDDYEDVAERNLRGWLEGEQSIFVNPVCLALLKFRDPDLVRQVLQLGDPSLLTGFILKEPDLYRFAFTLLADFNLSYSHWSVMTSFRYLNFSSAKEARQAIGPLTQAIMQAPADQRGGLLESFLDELSNKPSEARDRANSWARYVPAMSAILSLRSDISFTLIKTVVGLDKARGEDGTRWFTRLMTTFRPHLTPEADLSGPGTALRMTVPLGLALAGGDYESFERIALTAFSHSFNHDIDQIEKAANVLRGFPILCSAFARIFPLQPHRCMDLAVKMALVSRLGREAPAPLGYLEGSDLAGVDLPGEWQDVVAAAPGVEASARSYLLAQRVRGESDTVPPGVRKALEQPRRIAGELAYIEKKLAEDPARADLSARADNLRSRLANDGKLMAEVRVEIEERLAQAGAEAHIACAETKTLECYRARLETLAGPLPPALSITNDLMNATLLLGDIDTNRKLLVRLLRAYVRGDHHLYERHPNNIRFLDKLAAAGVDTQVWLSSNPRKYPCKGVAGGKVRLMLERDPLGILQMGNYFDTCLSFGQFNSYSTVTNACELNKRVVYAYDGVGKVVGRKLIGINHEGKLVGFYTYSALGEDEGKALRAIFRRYCADFAQKCGLELAVEGTIPRLFAEAWYDDGVVPWSDAEDEQAAQHRDGTQSGSRPEPEPEPGLEALVSAVP